MAAAIVAFLCLGVAALYGSDALGLLMDRRAGIPVTFASVLIVCLLFALIATKLTQYRTFVVGGLETSLDSDLPLLILRSPGDEASAVFGVSRLVDALASILMDRISSLANRAMRCAVDVAKYVCWPIRAVSLVPKAVVGKGAIAYAIASIVTFSLVSLTCGGCDSRPSSLTALVLIVLPALFLVILVVAAASWLVVAVIGALAAIPILLLMIPTCMLHCVVSGPESLIRSVLIEFSAEATPIGTWSVTTFDRHTADEQGDASQLAHSALYEDERAIDYIAQWIIAKAGSIPSHDFINRPS